MVNRLYLAEFKNRLVVWGIVAAVAVALSPAAPVWSQAHDDHAHGGEEKHSTGLEGHDDLVVLDEHDIKRMGIVVAAAGSCTIRTILRLPGEIVLNEDRLAHIVPRFNGIVREVRKRLGDKVSAGAVMAVIESNTSLQTYQVKSLIAGVVVGKHITLGEFVTTESDVYIVADLSDVWIDIAVYARDQGSVSVGQEVQVRSNDLNLSARAVVSYVSPLVDEHTRTSLARAVLPNAEGGWRPGSFVTAELLSQARDVPVAVPTHAIETMSGHPVVFVQTDDGFSLREVTMGMASGRMTEIVAGLEAGEIIVVEGSFTLKAELMKESFGDGHGH